MKSFLVLVAVSAMVPLAGGQEAATVSFSLIATDGGGQYWFQSTEFDGRNPALSLPPGAHVHVTITNSGNAPHNVHFGAPLNAASNLIMPGDVTSLDFAVPMDAKGTSQYWCDPHRTAGMVGDVVFGAAGTPQPHPSEATRAVPAAGAALLLVLLLCLGLRRPPSTR